MEFPPYQSIGIALGKTSRDIPTAPRKGFVVNTGAGTTIYEVGEEPDGAQPCWIHEYELVADVLGNGNLILNKRKHWTIR